MMSVDDIFNFVFLLDPRCSRRCTLVMNNDLAVNCVPGTVCKIMLYSTLTSDINYHIPLISHTPTFCTKIPSLS